MIHSIRIDGETVTLVPEGVSREPNSNIFNADSMMLFVGANGSGKTRMLTKIAETVLEKDSVDVSYSGDLSNLRVIYLTLSPFGRPEMDVDDPRFQALYRSRVNEPIVPAAESFRALAEEFNLPAKVQLKFGDRAKRVLQRLRDSAYSAFRGGKLKGPQALVEMFKSVELAREKRHQDNLSMATWFESSEYAAVKVAEKKLEELFERILRDKFGSELELHLLAIHMTLSDSRDQEKARRSFLVNFGVEISPAPPHKAATKRLEGYLNDLRRLGVALEPATGDELLQKSRYEFDIDRLNEIADVDLLGLAEIEMVGMSSGMAALFSQFSLIQKGIADLAPLDPKKNDLLLLIDEGDVFLHMAWQQRYVNYLNTYVLSLRKAFGHVQVVLTTHSPVLMSDFPRDHIRKLQRPTLNEEVEFESLLGVDLPGDDEIVSFGAPLESIVRHTGDSGTIGVFAAGVIKQLIDDLRAGKSVSPQLIKMIDDPVLRKLIAGIKPKERS